MAAIASCTHGLSRETNSPTCMIVSKMKSDTLLRFPCLMTLGVSVYCRDAVVVSDGQLLFPRVGSLATVTAPFDPTRRSNDVEHAFLTTTISQPSKPAQAYIQSCSDVVCLSTWAVGVPE